MQQPVPFALGAILSIVLATFSLQVWGLDCAPADLMLVSQAEVDALSVTEVTTVTGQLTIGRSSITSLEGLSNLTSVGGGLNIYDNAALTNLNGLTNLTNVGGEVDIGDNLSGCNSVEEILATVNPSQINPGLNDAWYYPETSGQGFFITVFPDLGYVSLAWFTYDTELPPLDAVANLGDPGHRWITAVGPIEGNQVFMNIETISGGIFDSASEIIRTDPPGSDGTIILTFDSCNSGTVDYDIPSINMQGIVPIQRIAGDNIVLCEALNSNLDQPLFPAR